MFDNSCVEDLTQLKKDLRASGHNETMVEELEPKAAQRAIENELYGHDEPTREYQDQIVSFIRHFQEIKELKKMVGSLEPDFKQICML